MLHQAELTAGLRRKRREPLELGLTPLIDIVFLLLIFFMLTSRFIVQEGLEVDLPRTEKQHAVSEEKVHVIYLLKDGTIMYREKEMSLEKMENVLSGFAPHERKKPFEVRSDRYASVQSMVALLEVLREAGAYNVSVGTVQETGSEQ